jgi:hypothetical protein
MRRTIPLFALVPVVLLLVALPAAADQPVFTHDTFTYETPEAFGASCSGFELLFTATADHYWTDYYAHDGTNVRTQLRFYFTGTLYNSTDITKSLPYSGHGIWTFTLVGERYLYNYSAEIGGHPAVLLAGGDFVYYKTGQEIFHGFSGLDAVCAALS